MRIAVPQLNYHTGDVRKNYEIMLKAIAKGRAEKADLIVFPELAVCGPFPGDWLERETFIDECRLTVDRLAEACGPMAAIIGAPNLDPGNGIMYNSAYFIQNGEVCDGVHKTILSDYDIFDESRYFVAGEDNSAIRFRNQNIRILFDEYEAGYIDKQDQLILFIGLQPFTTESLKYRKRILSEIAEKYHKPVLSFNPAGGSTSLLFDGNTLIYNDKGAIVSQLKEFAEDFILIDTTRLNTLPSVKQGSSTRISLIHRALIYGIRDYFYKHGFNKAVLGLSGGIDSAVVCALAAEALGSENVTGILMPSAYSSEHSVTDAETLARNLKIPYQTLPIGQIYDSYLKALSPLFRELPFNVAEENLQARIRGALVMAFSNKFGHILLNTSNKSEAAVGYGTLYGDLCGSLSVIADVYKTDVYRLAEYINREKIIIPENTIQKAPSAELRPGQKDQDSLPAYDTLDAILKSYLEENLSAAQITAQGFSPEIVEKIILLVNRNEYKRAQFAPILKISKKAFGNGRRMPF